MALLEVKNLSVSYGLINAVKGVSFEINEGEIVSLIGANGAGKTTIMHSLSGLIPAKSGSVKYNGKELLGMSAHRIPYLGLVQVPEGRRVFTELSVMDNLTLGAYKLKDRKEIERNIEEVFEIFPRLKERINQSAGTLSGGEQQMLAVGRAFVSKPKMLLLDEPSMGLSPLFVNTIFQTIETLNKRGVTIFLVEQNAKKALSISKRAYVLEIGRVVASGDAKDLINDEKIREAYLGK